MSKQLHWEEVFRRMRSPNAYREFFSSFISWDSFRISKELGKLIEFFQDMAESTPTLHYGPS